MDWRTRRAVTLAAAGGVVLGGVGSPPASATTMVPLSNSIRGCDFTKALFLGGMGSGTGSGHASIGADGSHVGAEVMLQSATPYTDYRVRLIQLPRPSVATCNAGDPGVAGAVLHTDASGTATVTVAGPLSSDATQAWVVVEGPPAPGRIRGDVYTSDYPVNL
ncbi:MULTISPECIES: hypothetical protein [Mycobacterium]|uniref:Secreted protein n=1 Tax=Mycobacterium syngnathidarum TaxID=1908205 RepID=A0A1Q9WEM1_9MYCO|nr:MULTISPECIES: hypothetical protein [Mycobacterium]MCG7607925.1 hypothetical protein [Mycobacterium sp. CnD-18-1]OHU00847.1 hypothetical protein BKG61_12630 [Mycobacterium syngnathidarum]OLT97220.1 hypothetical protein BKG60_06165 [Mycobacterium syngnathidarum]